MNYPLVVEVAHPLCYLLGYDDHLQISDDQVIWAAQVNSGEQVIEAVQVISAILSTLPPILGGCPLF